MLRLPLYRDYLVYLRELHQVASRFKMNGIESFRYPNLWWSADRAWCVATEIDYRWSYVGGSQECIGEILADDLIEAIPTSVSEGNLMEL